MASDDHSASVNFLAEKVRCETCLQHKTMAYFSMQRGRYSNNHCNTCRIVRSGFEAPKRRTGWWELAACHIKNKPADPKSRRLLTEADLEVLFFPNGLGEINRQAWKPICDNCPVRLQCGEWGKLSGSSGVWGGEFRPYDSTSWTRTEGAEREPVSDRSG